MDSAADQLGRQMGRGSAHSLGGVPGSASSAARLNSRSAGSSEGSSLRAAAEPLGSDAELLRPAGARGRAKRAGQHSSIDGRSEGEGGRGLQG